MRREAIYNPYNLLMLATATGLSAMLLTPIPLLIGILCEAVWIAFASWRLREKEVTDEPKFVETEWVRSEPILEFSPAPEGREVDNVVDMIGLRASGYPEDTSWQSLMSNARLLSTKVLDFQMWRNELLGEVECIVESARSRYDERQNRNMANVDAIVPGEAFGTEKAIRFGSAIDGVADLDNLTAARGSVRWIELYRSTGKACLESELEDLARRRANTLYASEHDELLVRSEELLVDVKRLHSLARLAINVGYELDMLTASGDRLADELRTRPPSHLNADLTAVLMHAESLVRSSGP